MVLGTQRVLRMRLRELWVVYLAGRQTVVGKYYDEFEG